MLQHPLDEANANGFSRQSLQRGAVMKEIPKTVQFYIDEMKKEFADDCVDNFRWADVRIPEDVGEYMIAYKNGCCGFRDIVVNDWYDEAPILYLVGCNYGH